MLEFPIAVVVYCVLVAAVFLGLWLFYDRRDHMRFDRQRRRATFHCIRCDRLYTGPEGTELCTCPRCGHENARLRFELAVGPPQGIVLCLPHHPTCRKPSLSSISGPSTRR